MNMLRRMVRTTNVHQGPELDSIEEGGNVDAQSDSPADSQPPPAGLVNAAGDTHGTEELQVAAGSPAPGFPATDEQQLTTRLLREQKAESFMACVKNKFKPTMLLMTEQEILNCCINPTAAPEAFREAYDTQKRFWLGHLRLQPGLGLFLSGRAKDSGVSEANLRQHDAVRSQCRAACKRSPGAVSQSWQGSYIFLCGFLF